MTVYRAFPWDASAADDKSGGALFVATSSKNRISNPDLYSEIYVADSAEAAVAEALGDLVVWRPATFTRAGQTLAIGTYDLADRGIFDLDDIAALHGLGVKRPSRIVTPDRLTTQEWARRIFERKRYAGAGWWSHYNADWRVYGIWDPDALRLSARPEPLSIEHPAVIEAATAISKQRLLR